MEFYIKKNATLPLLKLQVVKNGRLDYNNFMSLIEQSALFFSMTDVETGVEKIVSRPAGFVEKTNVDPNAEKEYYLYYQFQNRDTNKVGRYEGQFMLRNSDGVLILPIREKLYINIQESFIADDLEYNNCYTSEFPCCVNGPFVTLTPTCPTCTPCVTQTPTPTLPPILNKAYLFIEPISSSTIIGSYMFANGSPQFFGFSNSTQPSSNTTDFNKEMNDYIDCPAWGNNVFPSIIQANVPFNNGGVDTYGNLKVAYNFETTKVPINTVNGLAWYTWIIPTIVTDNKQQIDIDVSLNNPMVFTTVGTEPTIRTNTFTYSGTTIPQTTYRVYTTFPSSEFLLDNSSDDIYFKGNQVA